jgi:hypothetical protein
MRFAQNSNINSADESCGKLKARRRHDFSCGKIRFFRGDDVTVAKTRELPLFTEKIPLAWRPAVSIDHANPLSTLQQAALRLEPCSGFVGQGGPMDVALPCRRQQA